METLNKTQKLIRRVISELEDLLIAKNRAYGNSALEPVRVFSKADPIEQINVRLDDKLSRLARGSAAGEDVEWDLMGYLVLKRVAVRLHSGEVVEDEGPNAFLPPLSQDELHSALRVLVDKIEDCGASTALTDAVVFASDLAAAVGSKHNALDEYAIERVLRNTANSLTNKPLTK